MFIPSIGISHKAPDISVRKNPLQDKKEHNRKSKRSATAPLPSHNLDEEAQTTSG